MKSFLKHFLRVLECLWSVAVLGQGSGDCFFLSRGLWYSSRGVTDTEAVCVVNTSLSILNVLNYWKGSLYPSSPFHLYLSIQMLLLFHINFWVLQNHWNNVKIHSPLLFLCILIFSWLVLCPPNTYNFVSYLTAILHIEFLVVLHNFTDQEFNTVLKWW